MGEEKSDLRAGDSRSGCERWSIVCDDSHDVDTNWEFTECDNVGDIFVNDEANDASRNGYNDASCGNNNEANDASKNNYNDASYSNNVTGNNDDISRNQFRFNVDDNVGGNGNAN